MDAISFLIKFFPTRTLLCIVVLDRSDRIEITLTKLGNWPLILTPLPNQLKISRTQYRIQLGHRNYKWAIQFLKGDTVIDEFACKEGAFFFQIIKN